MLMRRIKKAVIPALLLLAIVPGGGYSAYTLSRPLPQLTAHDTFAFSRPAEQVSLDWPSFGEAAIGALGYNVLATHGGEQPLPTASTIKVLTALAVLRQKPLVRDGGGPLITLTQEDVDSYNKYVAQDGSVVQVAVGEQISEYQALQAMLLPSANNMAETLARWAFGSIAAYCTYAQDLARSLGMNQTIVTDPSGFLPATTSTPYDLTLLVQAAMGNPIVTQIVQQSSATIPVQGEIRNVNALLGQDGIIGLKTGNNDQDKGAFLFAAVQSISGQNVTLIGAIMDGPTLGQAMWSALPLIKSMTAGFTSVTIAKQGTALGTYNVPWRSTVQAIAEQDLTMLTWRGQPVTTTLRLDTVHAPLDNVQSIGEVTAYNGSSDESAHQSAVPVILDTSISKPSIFWRLLHPRFGS